ncbi:MAG: hydrolase 2, exosortase A system-associated [Rhodospirillales bacterium]|nr:MAG: hydrolase 2, exosortase A system-associated [Rhodospirillales bacterium]
MPKPQLQPVYLEGPAGRLFAILVAPAPDQATNLGVVYLPPFGEEMNRSRRMATLQARSLAAAGVSVLLLDLFGTGESDGDFVDARWEIWREDVAVALRFLEQRGCSRRLLWGLRTGALLAAEVAADSASSVRDLVLWQPLPSGDAMINNLLRTRVAAAMDGSEPPVTTAALRATLGRGESIEISGYEVAPALAAALGSSRLEDCRLPSGASVRWLEIAAEAGRPLAPASQRLTAAWREAGLTVVSEVVAGEPFWALQEITLAPSLLDATLRSIHGSFPERARDRFSMSGR